MICQLHRFFFVAINNFQETNHLFVKSLAGQLSGALKKALTTLKKKNTTNHYFKLTTLRIFYELIINQILRILKFQNKIHKKFQQGSKYNLSYKTLQRRILLIYEHDKNQFNKNMKLAVFEVLNCVLKSTTTKLINLSTTTKFMVNLTMFFDLHIIQNQ